ncbi:Uncharacterised protein [Sebaldella termitidis]|uniref:Outer membrane autotransporter barrel domain protein n=1 Tax=Sebaldella termitidis (strain ATCC 33386 / NCTC 11300) TaxID=526218 RepID=D1ALC7_SEBTE|nr:autotransporter domain-containing protein [Sebaldella termitidis]ACZ09270.1 outer membrane autotransporter barrel domain protein [Sebaldella termitidis ATCC 33386]SUI24591.1 Uncharacterised protein [Sebaldella termitidis]
MLKNKKRVLFLLAANSILSAGAYSESISDAKYEKLYNNMVKNIQTGKSNESNNKLIESILKKRNKELKDLYAQSDYIVKPEYLEWQIFASGFYAEKDRGYDSDKYGDGSSQKNSMQVDGTDLRTAKQIQIGATIPIKTVNDFALEPEISINKKEITVDSIQAPSVIPKTIPTIVIPNVSIPVITAPTVPSTAISTVTAPDIDVLSSVNIPSVNLTSVTTQNLRINSSNVNIIYSSAGIYNNNIPITLSTSSSAALGITAVSNSSNEIINNSSIIGAANQQGQVGFGYIPGNVSGAFQSTFSTLTNNGSITMNSKNSAGMILIPDIDTDPGVNGALADILTGASTPGDTNNVVQKAINNGSITINGSRSYAFLTSPYYDGTGSLDWSYNFGITNNGNSAYVSNTNTGTIHVNGDEATGFTILKGIHQVYNFGSILVGVSSSDNAIGYDTTIKSFTTINGTFVSQSSDGNLSGNNISMVEGASALYASKAPLEYGCDPSICTGYYKYIGDGQVLNAAGAVITIGKNAVESSGIRVEGTGSIQNRGIIKVIGTGNYGMVATGNGNVINLRDKNGNINVGLDDKYIGIFIQSSRSVGTYVQDSGNITIQGGKVVVGIDENGTKINDFNNNIIKDSAGIYAKNGNISILDISFWDTESDYGKVITNAENTHAVILTRENSTLSTNFYNQGLINNQHVNTIGVYVSEGAEVKQENRGYVQSSNGGLDGITTGTYNNAQIISGDGAIGVYAVGTGLSAETRVNIISGKIIGGNSILSPTTATSIGVLGKKNAEITLGNAVNSPDIIMGTNSVSLLIQDKINLNINNVISQIGTDSVFGYFDKANGDLKNINKINFQNVGANSILFYMANNSDVNVDSDFTLTTGGVFPGTTAGFISENSKISLDTGRIYTTNTAVGLTAQSVNGKTFSDGTVVNINKNKTGAENRGTIIMTSASAVGMYTKYGTSLNNSTGLINIIGTDGIGMYSEEEADIKNSGKITLNNTGTIGLFGKGNSGTLLGTSTDTVNIVNNGIIELNNANSVGIYINNNKNGAVVTDAIISNNATGTTSSFGSTEKNTINVKGDNSIGIYAPFSIVLQNGNIDLVGTGTVAIYGSNGSNISGGGNIDLNTASQSQVAYYLKDSGTKLTNSLGDITGHGVVVFLEDAEIDDTIPTLDLTTSSDLGNGKIVLALKGASIFNYTKDIKTGDSVSNHYAVALYTDNQNLSSGIANNLTAGANGVGIYAQNGSNIKYSGTINVGNNTVAGTGVYIGTNSGIGSSITLDNAVINLNGAGGIGAYVDNLSTLTFQANSVMNFSGDGVGIYGVQGAIINDNGGVINSNGYAVERTRIQGGIININSNINVSGGSILGHAVNGEISVLPGAIVTASGDDVIGIFGDGLKGAGTWTQAYEANNLGTIDFSSSNKATAIYLNNARGENKGTVKVNDSSIAFYGQGNGSEIYNNGAVEIGNNSVGLYGNDIDIIENLSGAVIKDKGTSNTGIYNIKTTSGATAINNNGLIELGNDGVGIYAENSVITNTGNIIVGDKVNKNSLGIYAKDSILNDIGNVKVGNSGIAYYGDNSTLNLNAASVDIGNDGVLAYGINNTFIDYNLGNKTTSENTFVYLINSNVDFNNAEITVGKNGLGVYQDGASSTLGYKKLYVKENGAGIYGYQTNLFNVGDIELTEKNSVGIIAEDSDATNNALKTIKTNDSNSVGIYSVLKNALPLKSVINNGEINVSGDKSIGIYGNTLNSAGASLGTIEIWNNNSIKLGNASNINNAIIGIYGTEGTEINTNAVSTIFGGSNVVGIYSDNGIIDHKGLIDVQDNSVGVYASGGTANIDNNSAIKVGNNGAVALYVNDGGVLTNNSSNITVGNESIIGYSKDSGTLLKNTGNLSVGTESVAFYSSSGEIENSGTLTSTGDGVIFFYGNSGKITNSGVINGSGNGYGVGIYGKASEIINTNNITLGDSKIVNASNPSDSNNRYSVGIYGDSSKIYNDGNISLGESGIGIYSYRQSDDLINDSNALITSNKDKAIGILAEVGNGKKVINKGEINLSGKESIGIALNNGVILENTGKIQVSGDKSIGIMATKDSEIYNSGVINASGNESIAVLLRSNSKLVNTGIINLGSGTLGVVADNDSSVSGYAVTPLESTSVQIPSIANVPTYKPPTIVNAGIIQVGEKFEVPYDGVVQVKVDPDTLRTPTSSEVSTSDLAAKFLVSSSVKFIAPEFNVNDVTVTSDFTQGTSSKNYKLADVFIPSTPGGGINSGIATILSQSYTWDATPVTNSNGNVDIWMQKIEYADLLDGYWNEDFGKALDEKYENASGDALKIFNKIDRLENEKDFKHIMSSLAGNIYANINQRENDIAGVFENSLDLLESSENNTKENVKVNIIGGKGRTNEDTDGVAGYDYTTAGVLGLREVERTYKQTFGYSLGYLHTGFEFKDNNESEEWVDTIQVGIHNKYKSNNWKLRNDLTGRISFHNIDRNLDWPSPNSRSEMNGTYETYSITSDNILGKEISLGKNSSLTPYGGLRAMYVTRPTFSESGLEGLEVEGNDAWSVKPRAGLELQTAIPLGSKNGWQLKGKLDFAYEYELANLNEKEKARLIAIEDGYHDLAKPEEENGQFKTRAALGLEVNERYGIFINGEYTFGEHNQDEYRAGVTLKAVF